MTVALGHFSRSIYVANASLMLALIWVGTMILYFLKVPGESYNAVFELSALLYFYMRWSAPAAQHRQFHFVLMCSYLFTTGYYVWVVAMKALLPGAFAMNDWWWHLSGNLTFAFELAFVCVYSLLRRRAKADTDRWRDDSAAWLKGYKSFKSRFGTGRKSGRG